VVEEPRRYSTVLGNLASPTVSKPQTNTISSMDSEDHKYNTIQYSFLILIHILNEAVVAKFLELR